MRFINLNSAFLVLSFAASTLSVSLQWANCTQDDPPNLSCAELNVPVDWNDPNGEQVTLAIAKLAATGKKIGALLFNPGGPGISTVDLFFEIAEAANGNSTIFPPEFDVIGPDCRGVGHSRPLKCDPKYFNKVVQNQPINEKEFEELVSTNKKFGESCRSMTGPVFDFLDSASVAKDFNAIREALGGEKLTYLGLSYGTIIGQAYAELFPNDIRAMALDGNLDHSLSPSTALSLKAYTYENVFRIFAKYCSETKGSPLYGQDIIKMFNDLVAKAEKAPIAVPYCKNTGTCLPAVTAFDIRYNFQNFLTFKSPPAELHLTDWIDGAYAIKQASEGNATLLSSMAASSPNSEAFYLTGLGTLCLDWNLTATSLSDLIYLQQLTTDISPITGGASSQYYLQTSCLGWPAPVRYVPHTIAVTGLPKILMTNAFHDPETPYTEANSLMAQLPGAELVTRRGDGHTSYFLLGKTFDAINEYLVTLKTPPPNTILDS